MIVAVASGKGGAGKTTVTASLAQAWGRPVLAADLDVEAPNLALLLHPEELTHDPVGIEVPEARPELCNGCGACATLCQYGAIAVFGDFPTVFPDMCHGCGGCLAVCPTGALVPATRSLGEIARGSAPGITGFLEGRLRIGEAMSPPLIRAVRRATESLRAKTGADVLFDAPPGVSCPAIQAVRGADAILLVAEPTPFGLHDFRLAHAAFTPLGRPMAVVINRAGRGDDALAAYCREVDLPVLAEISFDRRIAMAYAEGRPPSTLSPAFHATFEAVARDIRALAESPREAAHD